MDYFTAVLNSKDIPHFDLINYFKKYESPVNCLSQFFGFDRDLIFAFPEKVKIQN